MKKSSFGYKALLRSADLNQRFGDLFGGSILNGFRLHKGTSQFAVSVRRDNDDPSVLLTPEGIRLEETDDVVDAFTLRPNTAVGDRYDVIYANYADKGENATFRYEVMEGVPGQPVDVLKTSNIRMALGYVKVKKDQELAEADFVSLQTGMRTKTLIYERFLTLPEGLNAKFLQIEGKPVATESLVTQKAEELKGILASKTTVDALATSLGSGGPKGVYPTLVDLQTARPTGDSNVYVVTADGKWYYWNTSAWVVGGTYQSTGIADNSISISKIEKQTRETVEFVANRVNETMTRSLNNHFTDITNITAANATVSLTPTTGILPNDEGKNIQVSFTNASASHISVQNIPLNAEPPAFGFWLKKSELLSSESALEIYPTIWFQNSSNVTLLNIAMDGANGAPVLKASSLTKVGSKFSFTKSGVTLFFESISEIGDFIYWVTYTDTVVASSTQCRVFLSLARKTQAITLNIFDPFWTKTNYKLTPRFKSQIIPYPLNKYQGKRWVTLGDSITWQDGKQYTQNSLIARGYQTICKEKLGFSEVLNMGVSGRPMVNGSANGAGTNTTGKTVDYTSYDLVTIAAGTNDFKLNVPLGSLGVVGDVTFDTNTFYGAYRDLIEYILVQKPTQKIILFTPLQRDNGGYSVNTINTSGHKLLDYVNAIKGLGVMYSLPVVDMYAESGLMKLNLAAYTWDGLHPNDAGYIRMAELAIGSLLGK